MTTITKIGKVSSKSSSYGNNYPAKKHSEKGISNSLINPFNEQAYRQPRRLVKPANTTINKYWMRDWMEQLNFLKAGQEISVPAKNEHEDICYYVDLIETV